jgi:hypothetical protein
VLLLGVDPERRVHEEDIVQEQRSEPSKPQAVSEDDENCRNPASHWQAWLPTSFLTLPAPQATQLELSADGSNATLHGQAKEVGSAVHMRSVTLRKRAEVDIKPPHPSFTITEYQPMSEFETTGMCSWSKLDPDIDWERITGRVANVARKNHVKL